MHPSAILLAWLLAIVTIPWLDYHGLALFAVLLLFMPGRLSGWLWQIRRARWVLVTLWMVFAMGVPGEPLANLSWAPTYEGVVEANQHVLRWVLMLGLLSNLFAYLGRDGLIAALWGLMPARGSLGTASERLVVRLALVLENAYRPEMKGAWKTMLRGEAWPLAADRIALRPAAWCWRDGVLLATSALVSLGALVW